MIFCQIKIAKHIWTHVATWQQKLPDDAISANVIKQMSLEQMPLEQVIEQMSFEQMSLEQKMLLLVVI